MFRLNMPRSSQRSLSLYDKDPISIAMSELNRSQLNEAEFALANIPMGLRLDTLLRS